MWSHFHRHARFYLALIAAAVVAAAAAPLGPTLRVLLAGDTLFLVYLGLTLRYGLGVRPERLRAHAAGEDEGLPLILALTVVACGLNVASIFLLVNRPEGEAAMLGLLAIVSVPLGWLMLHTLAAFHYATLYYAPAPGGGDAGGLAFPGAREPGPWDFVYFAYVIGMTAQVSDVVVETTRMRQATLLHSVISFFYNAVILALAVNASLSFAARPG